MDSAQKHKNKNASTLKQLREVLERCQQLLDIHSAMVELGWLGQYSV
jgi:hypothetical protein